MLCSKKERKATSKREAAQENIVFGSCSCSAKRCRNDCAGLPCADCILRHAAKKTRLVPLCCHAPVSKESTQHQSLAMSSALRYYILPVQGAGPRICSTTISRPPSIPMNRSDPTAHEDHFNLPACWGGTKAEAEAMRAKKAKRRIILEVVYVMWRQRIIRVRVSRGGVQRRFRQSARAEGAEGRRRKQATIDRRKPSSSRFKWDDLRVLSSALTWLGLIRLDDRCFIHKK